jgi:hypothetical protein
VGRNDGVGRSNPDSRSDRPYRGVAHTERILYPERLRETVACLQDRSDSQPCIILSRLVSTEDFTISGGKEVAVGGSRRLGINQIVG